MRIVALNATYRPKQSTTKLTQCALDGAASIGADTEMVLLRDHDIQYCKNCLSCYRDVDSELPACTIDDDMDVVLHKVLAADGIILASPVHNAFVSGLMTVFFERSVWRLCRPTGKLLGFGGIPEPRSREKVRPVVTIVSAGGVPSFLRRLDDAGSGWMQGNVGMMVNGEVIGDLFAGAVYPRWPQGDEWERLYFMRKLTDQQLEQARRLGVKLATVIRDGRARPFSPLAFAGPVTQAVESVSGAVARLRRLLP